MNRTELLSKIIRKRWEDGFNGYATTDKEIYDCELNCTHLQWMLEGGILRELSGRNTAQEALQIIACELIYIGYQLAIEEQLQKMEAGC